MHNKVWDTLKILGIGKVFLNRIPDEWEITPRINLTVQPQDAEGVPLSAMKIYIEVLLQYAIKFFKFQLPAPLILLALEFEEITWKQFKARPSTSLSTMKIPFFIGSATWATTAHCFVCSSQSPQETLHQDGLCDLGGIYLSGCNWLPPTKGPITIMI